MINFRIQRINREFLRQINKIIFDDIKDEKVKNAILTAVRTSRDLSYARVFYTMLDSTQRDELQATLDQVAPKIRSILGKKMHLRTVPEIHFFFDESEVKAREMDSLLDKVMALIPENEIEEDNN
ncbi:MAG: 30S ribosome-binding factor RbfA [Synergistaceae bacterium]|nr:30S ribosome-binding factor RbfA [Synergistaceae bacterium]